MTVMMKAVAISHDGGYAKTCVLIFGGGRDFEGGYLDVRQRGAST
jgi:hypothetical protein